MRLAVPPIRAALAAALLLAGCDPGELPDQTRLPPNVRLTAYSGKASAVVDQTQDAKLVLPSVDTPVDFVADGFASLVGLARVELRLKLLVGCRISRERLELVPLQLAPMAKSWPASGPLVLHGFVEHSIGQRGLCRQLGVGGVDEGVSGYASMTAIAQNGLRTESRLMAIDNP